MADTVLVWCEEGVGDVVMFAACSVKIVLDSCERRSLLVVDPRLHPLFSTLFFFKDLSL